MTFLGQKCFYYFKNIIVSEEGKNSKGGYRDINDSTHFTIFLTFGSNFKYIVLNLHIINLFTSSMAKSYSSQSSLRGNVMTYKKVVF